MSAFFTINIHTVTAHSNSGLPRLRVQGFWKYEGDEPAQILGGVTHLTLGNTEFPPMPFGPDEIFRGQISQREAGNNFDTYLYPDPEVLRHIEASKHETTVDLMLRMSFTAAVKRAPGIQLEEGYAQMQSAHVIKTAPWAAILKGFGLGGRWSASVVVPDGPLAKPFADLEPDLKKAFEHLSNGHYPEVLVSCRKGLEQLWDAIGDSTGGSGHWPQKGAFSSSVVQKIDGLHVPKQGKELFSLKAYHEVEALFRFVSVGAHEGYVVTRPIAELGYSNTLLVLQMLSEALV